MNLINVHEVAQNLINQLEKSVETISGRIEGIALLYNAIREIEEKKQLDTQKAAGNGLETSLVSDGSSQSTETVGS